MTTEPNPALSTQQHSDGPSPSLGAFGAFGSFPFTLRRFKLRKPVRNLATPRKSGGHWMQHLDAAPKHTSMESMECFESEGIQIAKGIHKGIPGFLLKPG